MIPFAKHPWLHFGLYAGLSFALIQWLGDFRFGSNLLSFTLCAALIWSGLNRPARRGLPWLAAAIALGIGFALWEQPLAMLLVPLLGLCLLCWALGQSHPREVAAALAPFEHLPATGAALGKGLHHSQPLCHILMGCLLALPLLVLIGLLLASAEDAFSALFTSMFSTVDQHLGEGLFKLLLTPLIGLYLCLICQHCQTHRTAAAARAPQGDAWVISAMLTLLCLMYLLFLWVSAQVLPTLFEANHGAEIYSRYARQGFFELCAAAAINLMVCLFTRRYAAARQGVPRLLNTLLAVCTLGLIALALIKMALYIHLFGLTMLRFYTSCFMVGLAAFFALLIASLFRPLSLGRWGLRMTAVALVLLSLVNVGGFITETNARRYLAGELAQLDLTPYHAFPRSAAPALAKVYDAVEDPALRLELEDFFRTHQGEIPSLWQASRQAIAGQQLMNDRVP